MFPYRGLFLAVTISLTSVVLADVIVQPGYDHSGKNPYYSQPASHRINSQTEQYHTKQLPNQELRYLQSARTVYPYHESKDYSSNQIVGYPYHPFHHYSPRNHPHYARIGSHGYSLPSVFVGYRQPSVGHYHGGGRYHGGDWYHGDRHRYRRSLDSNSTNTESNESANVAHDNDVASKSPLTDDKHPKATDSLLPEHEPTDTNDKHVENRHITIEPVISVPRLFGIYPQNIQFPEQHASENTMQGIMKFSSNPSTLNLDENSQENKQNARSHCDENSRLVSNRPFSHTRFPGDYTSENTMQGAMQFYSNPSTLNFDENSQENDQKLRLRYDQMSRLITNRPVSLIRFPEEFEPSNDDCNSKAAPRAQTDDFSRLNNMRHQWPKYYDTYTPSYISPITGPKPPPPTPKMIYDLLHKMMQAAKQQQSMITVPTRQDNIKPWTPDTSETTRNLESNLPESYIPLVSDFDQGNYPHHCLNCYKDPNYSSDNYKDNSDFQRNSNSAYSIEPLISIPNNNHIPNYDPNYAPDIDISDVPDYQIDED